LVPAGSWAIVNAQAGANKAEAGFYQPRHVIRVGLAAPRRREFVTAAQPFGRIGVTHARPAGAIAADQEEFR
jgi:hypothetical protein